VSDTFHKKFRKQIFTKEGKEIYMLVIRRVYLRQDVFRAPDIDEAQRRKSLLIEKVRRDGEYRISEWLNE